MKYYYPVSGQVLVPINYGNRKHEFFYPYDEIVCSSVVGFSGGVIYIVITCNSVSRIIICMIDSESVVVHISACV